MTCLVPQRGYALQPNVVRRRRATLGIGLEAQVSTPTRLRRRAWTPGQEATSPRRALLADDVTFVGPLAATEGIDEYMRGIEGMAKIVERANVTRTAGWYLVRDGEITSVRAYCDPRPLTPSGGEDVNS